MCPARFRLPTRPAGEAEVLKCSAANQNRLKAQDAAKAMKG